MMKSAGFTARKCRSIAGLCFLTVGTGGAVSSCGGNKHMGSGPNAGDAGAVVPSEAGVESGLACQSPSDAAEPDVPAIAIFDGGVPLGQVAYALAVARCNYWSRCSPLAPYVVSECIEALSQTVAWPVWNFQLFGSISYELFPSAALVQAVDAGLIRYDPDQESACLQALQAQGCHGTDLWESVPACASVFTCMTDAGVADDGSSGGVAADGGENCSTLLETTPGAPGYTLLPCSAASDCAEAAWPGGPYCVEGYCAPGPCGDSYYGCAFVEAGQPCDCTSVEAAQPCDADPPLLGDGTHVTPWGTQPTRVCSSGLTCNGLTNDGGLGVCTTPQDIGGPCVQNAAITGCALGLSCRCGRCQFPPSRGPCASGLCQVGVAYCDLKSDICTPVAQIGGDCTTGGSECPPNLECNNDTSTCEPHSP